MELIYYCRWVREITSLADVSMISESSRSKGLNVENWERRVRVELVDLMELCVSKFSGGRSWL